MVIGAALIGHGVDGQQGKIAAGSIGEQVGLIREVAVVNHRQVGTVVSDITNFHGQLIGELLLDGGAELACIRRVGVVSIPRVHGEGLRCRAVESAIVDGVRQIRRSLHSRVHDGGADAAGSDELYRAIGLPAGIDNGAD